MKKYIIIISIFVLGIIAVIVGVIVVNKNKDVSNNDNNNEVVQQSDSIDGDSKVRNNNSSKNNTGKLSAYSTEYEGIEGTGDYNYGEALQKSILFYELQRSGDLPEETRCNWRGDSGLDDGLDVGLDLTGGWYDAGDHVKFNLPMSYTATMLAWSVYEDKDSYEKSGQLEYMLDNIRWANDYFIKCHPEKEVYYYQVGDGSADHGWWGPAEAMEMSRPAYKVTIDSPGSTVTAGTAASLAVASIIFKDVDKKYSEECLKHAIELYDFAEKTKSDDGYTQANGYYNSWSGFYDELSWAATWLYLATDDKSYLDKADKYFDQSVGDYKWAQCWDDVYTGTALLLATTTDNDKYKKAVEKNLDYWTTGTNGERITYTPDGLAWLDQWGALRYATTESFIALVYSEYEGCPTDKKDTYFDFGVSQVNYALGSSGQSYVVGYGEDSPTHPHHRTAQGSWSNNMNEPSDSRHILFGALVGGPDSNGGYTDEVSNYTNNEVACDYNAGYTCSLAKLYGIYYGKTLVDFGAVENVEEELSIEVGINASGNDFTELKAIVYNKTSWPARVTDKLVLAYFFDISEIIEAGGSEKDITITTNYMQGGKAGEVKKWKDNIYYVTIDFTGEKICPAGQDSYKREVQFRIASNNGSWNTSNDYSYQGLSGSGGGALIKGEYLALYDNGKLVYGSEPDENGIVDTSGSNQGNKNSDKKTEDSNKTENNLTTSTTSNSSSTGSVTAGDILVTSSGTSSNNSIGINISIYNSGENISMKDIEVRYYFTTDTDVEDQFSCDHSAITNNAGKYTGLSDVSGTFNKMKKNKDNADTYLSIKCNSNTLETEDTWIIQGRINKADWTNYNISNDYSSEKVDNIVILYKDKIIFGTEPK